MATLELTPGVLPPPACYDSEQARFNAYVAAIVGEILGGLQWEDSQTQPSDLDLYWLKKNASNRHVGPRKWSLPDARWAPWLEVPVFPDSSGGIADAYTATTGHNLIAPLVQRVGRRIIFVAAATNTGPSTLNVDGTGVIPIVRETNVALKAGDIVQDGIYEVIFNSAGGGRWELATPIQPIPLSLPTYITTSEFTVPTPKTHSEISHSGGKVPFMARTVLVCKTAVGGYSVGDELEISGFAADYDGTEPDGPLFQVSYSDTKVNVAAAKANNGMTYTLRNGDIALFDPEITKFVCKSYLMFLP